MRKFGIFLISTLLVITLALIILSSGLLPYILPVKQQQTEPSEITIPFKSTKQDQEQHKLTATPKLTIQNQLGNISILGVEQLELTVTLEKQAQSPNPLRASQLLDRIELVINQDQDTTSLDVLLPETADAEQILANLIILVPQDLNATVQAYTSLGVITVDNLRGNGAFESSLGKIKITNSSFKQELVALTNLGDLQIQADLAETNVLESNLGDLELILSPQQAYIFKGQLDLGTFTTKAPFTGQQTQQKIQGIIGSGEHHGQITVNLSLGSIKVGHNED